MQPRDLFRRRRPDSVTPTPHDSTPPDAGEATFDPAAAVPSSTPSGSDESTSIRDRQKQRRDTARQRHAVSAFLGKTPTELSDPTIDLGFDANLDPLDEDDEEDDEAEDGSPSSAVTGQVWIVFRSVSWTDANATLRESDSLVGVYATEASAKLAVIALDRSARGDAEHWYQPYSVTE